MTPLLLTQLKLMFDSNHSETAAKRRNACMRVMRGGGGNDNTGNDDESHHTRGSATKHAQSGNLALPFLATFAAHNTKCQLAHPSKPAAIRPSRQIGTRHNLKKRQKRQC